MKRNLLQAVGGRRLTIFKQALACIVIFAVAQCIGTALLGYQAAPPPAKDSPQFRLPAVVLAAPGVEPSDGSPVIDIQGQPYQSEQPTMLESTRREL
jgi:hypothetical protein